MFEQFVACLSPHHLPSEEETGRVVEQLKRIPYFHNLGSSYGADYLVLMVPILHPFILREGFKLIGQPNLHLLIEGDLREIEDQFDANRTIQPNRLLDLREKAGVRFVAHSDCKMITIRKGASAGLAHFQKRLIQKERQRNQQMAKLRKLVRGKEQKEKLEFLKQNDFFNSLGEYDLLDLAVHSHIKEYIQGSVTHSSGEEINAIGCVLSGKVKLSYSTSLEARREHAVSVLLTEGQWIGLEEYLWQGNFKSNGEAASTQAILVWIPRQVFHNKFNLKTNYHTMNRLTGLIQAKKTLFDRSLDCRKRKQIDLIAQGDSLKSMNEKLTQKISAMVVQQEKRKINIRKGKPVQQLQLPQYLLHRTNLPIDPSPNILPKLIERVNLFPQQYQKIAIGVAQRREMQRLAHIVDKKPKAEKEDFRQFLQHNPQIIYKSILNQIPHSPQPHSTITDFSKTVREVRPGTRSNLSMYNNFRVGKSQSKRQSFPKSKTLYILS